MNKMLKNIAFIVLGAHVLSPNSLIFAQENVNRMAGMMSANERSYINNLTNEIQKMFMFIQEHIMNFIEDRDQSTFREYVEDFTIQMDSFDKNVMVQLNYQIEQAKSFGKSPFYRGLIIVKEVLDEFLLKMKNLRVLLEEHLDKTPDIRVAINLGRRVKEIITDFIAPEAISRLEGKLSQLRKILEEANELEMASNLANIAAAIHNLQAGPALNISESKVLLCINKKLKRKNSVRINTIRAH